MNATGHILPMPLRTRPFHPRQFRNFTDLNMPSGYFFTHY